MAPRSARSIAAIVGAFVLAVGGLVIHRFWKPGATPRTLLRAYPLANARAAKGMVAPGVARAPHSHEEAWIQPTPAAFPQTAESSGLVEFAEKLAASDPIGAEQKIEQALERDPRNERALTLLALVRVTNEKFEAGREAAERCLALYPENKHCRNAWRWSYTRSGDFEQYEALTEYDCKVDPDGVECAQGSISMELRRGDTAAAERSVARYRKLDPMSGWPDFYAALVADKKGDRDSALRGFKATCAWGQAYACKRAAALAE